MFNIRITHILFFIISPFLLLIFNIRKYNSKYFPGILYLFCLFYGFTFTVASDAFDAARILQKFSEANKILFVEYSGIDKIFITGNTQIVENSIVWFVANTFGSSQILFLIYAAIFGFFYVKNFQIISKFYLKNNTNLEILLLLTFMFIIPIWEINGWRMWTASHIFIYSVFSLLVKGIRIKYILLILSTPFIHFSFWLMVLPVLLYFIMIKFFRTKILFGLFFLTLFINPFNFEKSFIENSINSEYAQSKISGYGNVEYLDSIKEKENQLVFHAKYYKTALHFGLNILFCILFFFYKKTIIKNDSILNWTLFFGIFVNGIVLLPIADMLRFRLIHYFFVIFNIVMTINNNTEVKLNKFLIYTVSVLLIFFNLTELRKGLDRFGIATIITNPITVGFFPQNDNTALINLIK